MKKLLVVIFGSLFYLLTNFSTSYALSPIDQVCSTGVAGSNTYSFIGSDHEIYQVFVPTKNTLDAVSVRVRTEIGESSNIHIKVLGGSEAPARVIAEGNATVGTEEEWLLFDFEDVAMPLGEYGIFVENTDENAHAIWKGINGDRYERGFAITDGQVNLDLDFGFAVYAYDSEESSDGSNPSDPVAAPADQNNTSQDGTASISSDESSSDKSSLTTSDVLDDVSESSAYSSSRSAPSKDFSKDEAEALVSELQKQNDSDRSGMLPFIFAQAIIPLILIGGILFLGLIGFIVLIIVLVRRKKNNTQQARIEKPAVKATVETPAPPKQPPTPQPVSTGKKSKAPLIVVIVILSILIIGGFGYGIYRVVAHFKTKPTANSQSSSNIISVTPSPKEENEFGTVLKDSVGDVTLRTITDITGGTHILYIPSKKLTSEDYQKIKTALTAKGYTEFSDTTFNGEKSIALTKEDKFIYIPMSEDHISISIVDKKSETED